MSNRRRRDERRALLAQAGREHDLARPRHIDSEVYYPGAGEPLVRLAWLPSFEAPVLWEVRSVDGVLVAFRSLGTLESKDVTGHEQLPVSDATLRSAIDDVALLALPLTPSEMTFGVADGVMYVATIYRGVQTGCRFSWFEGHEPEGWAPVVEALVRLQRVLENEAPPPPTRAQLVHVASTVSSVKLVRLDTGEFQVWDPGVFGSLLSGYDYILATEPLANALKRACGDDIELKPATVIRRATQESWASYVEVVPVAELSGPDDLPRARQSATRAWHYYRGHLFVGFEVKAALAEFEDLQFAPGFGNFGGRRSY